MRRAKITLALWAALAFNPAWAAACDSKSATDIAGILAYATELNEQFKQSVRAGDEARYRALRKQTEQYDEATAMPCVRKTQALLEKRDERALLRKLMEFTISHDNAADETVPAACGRRRGYPACCALRPSSPIAPRPPQC